MGARRRLADLAEENGVGPLRRVFRSRSPYWGRLHGWIVIGGAVLTLLVGVNIGLTPAAVVAVLAAVGYVCLVHVAPTGDPSGRRWIGVGDGGLVSLAENVPPVTVPWGAIVGHETVGVGTRQRYDVLASGAGGRTVSVPIDLFTGRADLLRAVRDRRPVPPPRLRRTLIAGGIAVVVGVPAWFLVLPDFVARSVSGLPADVGDLRRACERAGARFPDARAYGGAAPHPVALFLEDEDGAFDLDGRLDPATPAWNPSDPGRVQLVACVRRTGTLAASAPSCGYREQFGSRSAIRPMRVARYEIAVHALRTHERVATFRVDGDNTTCPETVVDDDGDLYSTITWSRYRNTLSDLVDAA